MSSQSQRRTIDTSINNRSLAHLTVTGKDIREARAKLGKMWGLNRPLRASELGRLLRLKGRDPGETILDWERGKPISGPASVALEMMLAGAVPPTRHEAIRL